MPVMTPWGEGYRYTDILSDITKFEHEYKIKRPKNWDGTWEDLFREYGFVPVDPTGYWWNRPTTAPEIPIIYAPVTTTSYTIPTGIETTTTTGLIDTVNVIGDTTFTELPTGETVATVTTAGAVSSVSSAVATGAVGAAIGFAVGVAAFEKAPEFWTQVSNGVFGTSLEPEEIGQMARDTNALVVIKEGSVYMAEDMINAIRTFFFELGAANTGTIDFPTVEPGDSVKITGFSSVGEVAYTIFPILQDLTVCTGTDKNKADYSELMGRYGFVEITDEYSITANRHKIGISIYETITVDPETDYATSQYTTAWTESGVRTTLTYPGTKQQFAYEKSSNIQITYEATTGTWFLSYVTKDNMNTSGRTQPLYFGNNSVLSSNRKMQYRKAFNTNGIVSAEPVPGITPTGKQGTKDQPLAVVFPEWVNKGIETVAGDGITKVKWLPVSLPATNPLVSGNPFTSDKAQEGTLPDNYTETANQLGEQTKEQTKNAPSYPTPPITPVPVITPTPSTPPITGGGGSATGLANLYNPTLAQVKEFSRWLWGSDGLNLDQLKKLLQDPMQAIIGLHVMYATPTTGENRDIQVGYINSGVSSKIVTEQYTEIDCGTVTINEYFGDARDYSPFTQVYCYLPFIGIVELNADDVVNGTLGIKYKIDVLTGCCLAQLTVKKYGLDAVLYTYTGNCAVQMPITSGNYLSTISSLLGAVASGAAAVASGGALAPVAIGAAANALGGGARASVAMSGSLGSNAGAMGIRKPYLIIKRVESADANGYNEFYGYPTNKRVNLSQLTGYVRVKDINLSGTNATEDEQNEIVTLLKEGVIL